MSLWVDATSYPMRIYGRGIDFPPFAPPQNAIFNRLDEGKVFTFQVDQWVERPAFDGPLFNIMSYGGNIQNTIAAAKAAIRSDVGFYAATVYIPEGEPVISEPLVLPRTGATPNGVIRLQGAGSRATRIRASASFPTNRAMIEWEATTTTQAWHQSIKGLGILLPNVSGVMGINYKPNLKSTGAECLAETLSIDMEDLLIEGSNQYHSSFIRLEGNVKGSTFSRISGDPSIGTWAQDTALFEFDTTDFGAEGDDSAGGIFCHFEDIQPMLRRGGYTQAFKGRLLRSSMTNIYGQQSRTLPTLELDNSSNVVVTNLSNEGGGSQPQVKLSNSADLTFVNMGIGSPVDKGSGVGNGVELVNVRDSDFVGVWRRSGNPSFTSLGKKMLTLDANCKRNTFLRWQLNAAATAEITNNSADTNDNYGEFYDIQNSARYYLGRKPLQTFTTATKPTAANWTGSIIYVSDGGAGAVFQGSNGAAWVNLG